MMKTDLRPPIVNAMKDAGIIPVFNHTDFTIVRDMVDAMYNGGFRVFEFTNRSENALDIFSNLSAHLSQYSDAMIGAGTILDDVTTQAFIAAGADFVVSPVLKISMGAVCRHADILWVPGCATPTEILTARDAGAQIVKIFPGSVLGPSFVSSVRTVIGGVEFMVTGGVEPDPVNLKIWFASGACAVGIGSQLITRQIVERRAWKALEEKTIELLAILRDVREPGNSTVKP